ncbi:hypothetical protein Tco_0276782 [Tanacetum coccineum]
MRRARLHAGLSPTAGTELALRERIVWRDKGFPLGFPALLVSTYLWKRGKVARGQKMRIQSRRSGRMVEESMDSLGIDSRWLDIQATTSREEESSTTELLAISCKGKDKTTFRTFLLVQTFE